MGRPRGAATEHAEREAPGGRGIVKRGAATEHAEKKAPGGRGTLKPNAQTLPAMEDAQADRATIRWSPLAEFLTLLLQDVWTAPGLRHAAEQAKLVCEDDCPDIVFEIFLHQGCHFYGERELLLHKRMWDIVTRDKYGPAKKQSFSKWCKRGARPTSLIHT